MCLTIAKYYNCRQWKFPTQDILWKLSRPENNRNGWARAPTITRSCAILQASLMLSPLSSSICCTHIRQGRPCWRFHSGLMFGLPPARVSTARCSEEWAGVASGSSLLQLILETAWGSKSGDPDPRLERHAGWL